MTPPADLKKRLAALETKFAVRLSAHLWITETTASVTVNGVEFETERGPEEGLDDFRARALRAAQARFPRAELVPVHMLEGDEFL